MGQLNSDNFLTEISVREWAYYKAQAALHAKNTQKSFLKISEESAPKEIEIGKKYLCVEHPTDLIAYSQFSPSFYSKLLKDNKLCLFYQHDSFKNKECEVVKIELYSINEIYKVLFWSIWVANDEGKTFECRYATRYSNDKYPPITVHELGVQLSSSQASPESIQNGFNMFVAMNHKGSIATYITGEVPNDWVVMGKPVVPNEVTSWHEFMCHPESKMMDEQGNLLSIDDWLKACNS